VIRLAYRSATFAVLAVIVIFDNLNLFQWLSVRPEDDDSCRSRFVVTILSWVLPELTLRPIDPNVQQLVSANPQRFVRNLVRDVETNRAKDSQRGTRRDD
jgi:hypothetical protein